jgi:hypothetical protein
MMISLSRIEAPLSDCGNATLGGMSCTYLFYLTVFLGPAKTDPIVRDLHYTCLLGRVKLLGRELYFVGQHHLGTGPDTFVDGEGQPPH